MSQEKVTFVLSMVPVLMAILGMIYLFLTWFTGAYWVNQNWKFFARVSVWFLLAAMGGCITVILNMSTDFYTGLLIWSAVAVDSFLFLGMAYLMHREYTKPLRK